jgi:endonuclease/exonuclease/phosphatase family metal-dependent hydrolase
MKIGVIVLKVFFLSIFLSSFSAMAKVGNGSAFSIMSYNVENLFDDQDDSGFDDETYLPLTKKKSSDHKRKCQRINGFKFKKDCFNLDWNQDVIGVKMRNLSQVILSVEDGKGPDILILVEVENKRILNLLNQNYLKSAEYKTVELIEGEDPRGIDIAILSRFPRQGSAELISLNIFDSESDKKRRTRGVLKVPLRVSHKKVMSVYGIHLPSQGSPTDTRIQGLKSLVSILKKDSNPWLVGGDFNITEKENRNQHLVENYLHPHGRVSHEVGCAICKGTHFYKGKWSFLDMLFFDHRYKEYGLDVIADSIQVISSGLPLGKKGSPQRFIPDKGQGASDHFPIYARLKVEK